MHVRHLMQAGRENCYFNWTYAQLAGFGTTRLTLDSNDVAQFDAVNGLGELVNAFVKVGGGHDLHLLRLASQIQKSQLLAHGTLRVHAACDRHHVIAHLLRCQVRVLVNEMCHGHFYVEFVRVDRAGALRIFQMSYLTHSKFKVFLFIWQR